MSSKARRLNGKVPVMPFVWQPLEPEAPPAGELASAPPPPPEPVMPSPESLAALEREAFAKGFAQGERAGIEAANQRNEAMLRRLTETLNELAAARATMIQQTEAQMVKLALAIARRVIGRE